MDAFSRAGLTFPVRDVGDPSGEAMVLLHGFPQDASSFAAVVPQLVEAGYRTLVPTQRGYAPMARPDRRRDYRLTELVGDALALLDAAGLRSAHVVGHDWGGGVAWGLASWHPERVASLTVLSTPHPAAMLAALTRSSQLVRSAYMGFFQLPGVPEAVMRGTLARTLRDSGLPDSYVARYCAAMAQPGALTGALRWYRGLPFSLRPATGRIRVHTTYVWGQRDFALGRFAAERTGRYVTGPYAFVKLDAGHWLPEAEPDAIARAVLERARR